jgi:ABC-type oligopeptide transport system substrate-binding subunit
VEVSIQLVEDTVFLTEISRRPNIYQLYALGWIADYPDPQNFLEIKFHSQSRDNQTGYSNPSVDALLDQASVEVDRVSRMELYRQAEEIIVQEAAWAPLWYGANHYLIKPYVRDLLYPPIVIPKLRYVSLEGN